MKLIDLLNKIANKEINDGTRFRMDFGGVYRDFYYDAYETCPMLCLKNISYDELFQDDYDLIKINTRVMFN